MFVFEADEKDIISGDITDREPELSLKKVRTKEMFYIEDGEIVRKLDEKDFNMKNEETGLLQRKKGVELELALPRYQVMFMHNGEERKALATQIEDLTNGKHSFGDFEIEDGFAINKGSMMVIVLPEKSLHERALFKHVSESFDFGYDADKLVPSFKSDPSLINYGVRENNNLGLTHFNGKTYRVFKENANAVGDSPTAIMLELDKSKVDEKLSNFLEATDLRISGDTVYQTYCSKSEPSKSFIVVVDLKDPSKDTVRNEKHLTDFCKNHRGSKSLSEFSSSLKEDLKEHTLLKFETHSSRLKAEEKERLRNRNDLRQGVSQDVEQKQTRRSKLRK
ncbi:hypothetical protein [Vibrio parahaemolyticus]